MKKEPESSAPKTQELLDLSLELSKMHLARLREKSRSQEGLTPHEGNAICAYVKTFSQIIKYEQDKDKEIIKSAAQLSDDELKKEIKKLMAVHGDGDED